MVGDGNGYVTRFEQADPPTALALAPQAVAENAASGTVVGTFATTDPTTGDTFTYSLVSGIGSTDNASFAIGSGANVGKLVTNAVFDYETKSSYLVRVRTTDATGLFTEQAFTISITDVVDTPSLTSIVPNNGPAGTSVTLTGTNFYNATAVAVNGTAGSITGTPTATSLSFTVGAGSTTGPVTLATTSGLATSAPNPVLRLQATGGSGPSGGDKTIYLDQVEVITTAGAVVSGAVANGSFETGPAGNLNYTPTTATPWTFTANGGNVAISTSASAFAPPRRSAPTSPCFSSAAGPSSKP